MLSGVSQSVLAINSGSNAPAGIDVDRVRILLAAHRSILSRGWTRAGAFWDGSKDENANPRGACLLVMGFVLGCRGIST